MARTAAVLMAIFLFAESVYGLEPQEILIIANKNIAESGRIARYYCLKRGVPEENILELPLAKILSDTIERNNYEKQVAEPIRSEFRTHNRLGKIRCLLTVYGMPTRVGRRGVPAGLEGRLQEFKDLAGQTTKEIEQLKQDSQADSDRYNQAVKRLTQIQLEIDQINGKETDASFDSELSMVLFETYNLFRWQVNLLKRDVMGLQFRTLMVSRLDGPDYSIAKGLVDKALKAEETGLHGIAYIDSRGLPPEDIYGHYDRSLRDLARLTRTETSIPVVEEQTAALFAPGSCPRAALYCGWYSLSKYVDAFDFVDGAIGYHIASFEAASLHDPNSSQWCPAMLKDGITATLGPVSEPYLHAFPEPSAFFLELYKGRCLVEAYYRTSPFNSWQLLLIGDPLYRPFKVPILKMEEKETTGAASYE